MANAPRRTGGSRSDFVEKYPRVKWMPELMVTEDRGFYCGGGVNASLDLSIYLVERFCGHEVAMQTAKSLLIETPRAWQSGFAIVPLKTDHTDDAISSAQEWMHKHFATTFPLEDPARRVGMSVRNFVRRFKQATGDSPLGVSAKTAGCRRQAHAGEPPSLDARDQRRGRVSGHRVFPFAVSATHGRIAQRVPRTLRHKFLVDPF